MTEFYASVPGSIMLMGEHAVLHGEPALVAAVDARLKLKLTPRTDKQIIIDCAFGCYRTTIHALKAEKPFDVSIAAISAFQTELKSGFEVAIDSANMPTAKGVGSSTALIVGITALMQQWLFSCVDLQLCFRRALASLRLNQGHASGADVAASVFGGVVYYQQQIEQPLVEKLVWQPNWVLLYCGEKRPTAEVIAITQARFKGCEQRLSQLYRNIGDSVRDARQAIERDDEAGLYRAVEQNQAGMRAMGLVHEPLEAVLLFLQNQPTIKAVKISGAGLGDCAIGFGAVLEDQSCPFERITIQLDQQGVTGVDIAA